jgi:hypothetical protein
MRIGILAYGSLINDPGNEIKELLIEKRNGILTPFHVEFAHKSKTRDWAPTLVPVEDGGSCFEATLLVLDENTELGYAKDILYRREIDQIGNKNKHYIPNPSNENQVYVEPLPESLGTFGIEYVLYTKIKANINPLTPDNLAQLAIESAKKEAGKNRKDGISYLIEMKENRIHTALSYDYEQKILEKTNTSDLEKAWQNVREEFEGSAC